MERNQSYEFLFKTFLQVLLQIYITTFKYILKYVNRYNKLTKIIWPKLKCVNVTGSL